MSSLYKRGRLYWGRAHRAGTEHRRSLKTADRSVAQKRLESWLKELDAFAWGERPSRLFKDASARFIAEHLTSVKVSTAIRYGVSIKNLAEQFDDMPLHRIGKAELSAFEARRRSDGVTPSTIRRDLGCLSLILANAEDWEWLGDGSNPVPSYMRRRAKRGLKEALPRTRYLSPAEEAALLAAASAECAKAITLAIETGLRRSELFGLTWQQVDLNRGLIDTTSKTKSGRARKVPLSARARTILGTVIRRLDSPYVLTNPETKTRYAQMNKGLKAAMRRADIKDLSWHDLRRTAGCRWLQDGMSMEHVSNLLGHASSKVTEQRYAFLDNEQIAGAIADRTIIDTRTAVKQEVC